MGDVLFPVRTNFYIGAYSAAINEAADIEGLSEPLQAERDMLVYRSYIELGSYEARAAAAPAPAAACAAAAPFFF